MELVLQNNTFRGRTSENADLPIEMRNTVVSVRDFGLKCRFLCSYKSRYDGFEPQKLEMKSNIDINI